LAVTNPWRDEEFTTAKEANTAEQDALFAEGVDLRVQSITGADGVEVIQDGNGFTVKTPQDISKAASPEFKTVSLSSMKQGSVPFISSVGGKRKLCQNNDNFRWNDKARSLWVNSIQHKNFQARELMAGYGQGILEDMGKYKWNLAQRLGTQASARAITYLGNGRVLAGTSANGRIYRSSDHGASWANMGTMIADETHIYSMCYCGNGIVIAGTRPTGKIGRSTDYGESWSDIGQLGAETYVMSLVYCGNGVVVAGTNPLGHIFRSTDYGATWAHLGQQFSETQVASLCYLGGGVVLGGTYGVGKIIRSTDSGLTWTDVNQNYQFTQVYCLAYLEAGICLAGTADGVGGKILRSTDFGITWEDLGVIVAGEVEIDALAYLGNGVALGSTAGGGHLVHSNDYGLTWTDLGVLSAGESSIRSICSLGDGVALAGTGTDANIFRLDHMRTPGLGVTYNPEAWTTTDDDAWHTETVTGAKAVLISVDWESATATHALYVYTRRQGSAETWEGNVSGWGKAGGMIIQPCDNPAYPGQFEYKISYDGGTLVAKIIGYLS
jgi:hypothetical protein